ncbi:MAG: M28 family peptidase [Acidimicrobiia bacterium]
MRRLSVLAVLVVVVFATACTPLRMHVTVLASDAFGGRNNATQSSIDSQNYIISRLKDYGATGLNTGASGDDSFRQSFTAGTNVIGVIKGSELPNEYVIVGGHYDHLGSSCRGSGAADSICNGATDNAAGAAATIEVGHAIANLPGGPRRSVIIALWDREEDGLLGSAYYVQHPLVPIAQTIAYVNFDIQGANLLPTLRSSSFAVGAETGGARLRDAVKTAVGTTLQTHLVSSIFGQGRSDYVNFTGVGVPNVFFSDSTGPCYHTVDDELAIVDFAELAKQTAIATKVTEDLVAGAAPTFVNNPPLATYADALELQAVVTQSLPDKGRFTPTQQAQLQQFVDDLNGVVSRGEAQFNSNDVTTLLAGASNAVNILTTGTCDGFLTP